MDLAGVEPGSLAGVSVLHDYLFGAGGREMLLAFHRAGANLRGIHFTPDGRFPLGDPNPVKGPVVREGLETLKRGDFLLGTFFDGDADRIDFYAEDGRYLSSSFVYAGILPYITARFKGHEIGVFADLKSNPLAVIEMAKAGVTVNVIRNGHSQIKDAMFEDHRMIGTVEESAHFYESFYLDGNGPYATENTLYLALLTTRAWNENPTRFEELFDLQNRTRREREWGHYFPTDADRANALDAVQAHFESLGAEAMRKMSNGLDLEATLMRRGLPFDIRQDTELASDWLQVCQRISQSENGLARWEVVAATQEIAAQAKANILRITAEHNGSEPYIG
jgi:phosphomannomutase